LYRVLLGRQAERVEAQRVQHVAAQHALEARERVAAQIAQRVPDVQALAGRVGEHVLHEQLVLRHLAVGKISDRVGRVVRAFLLPPVLPATFDLVRQLGRVAEGRDVLRLLTGRFTHRLMPFCLRSPAYAPKDETTPQPSGMRGSPRWTTTAVSAAG